MLSKSDAYLTMNRPSDSQKPLAIGCLNRVLITLLYFGNFSPIVKMCCMLSIVRAKMSKSNSSTVQRCQNCSRHAKKTFWFTLNSNPFWMLNTYVVVVVLSVQLLHNLVTNLESNMKKMAHFFQDESLVISYIENQAVIIC